jgi:hypothetical protein
LKGNNLKGNNMSTSPAALGSPEWKDLYRAALFEVDRTKLPQRIAEARNAVVLRARELFNCSGSNFEEEQELDDALYALEALCNCLLMDTRNLHSA